MLVYDKYRTEIIDAETGEVLEERMIDPGPEWSGYRPEKKRCHIMYRRDPESLRFFRGIVPKYVYEDAKYIMERLGLGGQAGALAAVMYSCRRFGVPLPPELVYFINADRRNVYRVYGRIVEKLGAPRMGEEAALAQLVGVAVRLGRPRLALLAVSLYRRLREKNQDYRSTTLAAVALVKTGLPLRQVSVLMGVASSTLFKALKRVET